MTEPSLVSRRALLGGALAGAAAIGLAPVSAGAAPRSRTKKPGPGTLPNPSAAPGTEQIPQIKNIVCVMMENHSYDNILGDPGSGGRLLLMSGGKPTNSNPWPKKSSTPPPSNKAELRAFPMPTPCQQPSHPYNTWEAAHVSYSGGRNDGFVKSQSGPVSMGYYDQT